MSSGRLLLGSPNRLNRRILLFANRTLDTLTRLLCGPRTGTGNVGRSNGRNIQTPLMETMLAQKVHCREIETPTARSTAPGLEDRGFSREVGELLALGGGRSSVAGDQIAVIGNLPPLLLNRITQVLLNHAHRRYSIRTQRLDHLQRRHQTIFVDLFKHGVQFRSRFLENSGRRGEVGERGGVELGFFGAVFPEGFDGAGGVAGGGVGAEDVDAKALLFADEDGAVAEVGEVGEEEDVGGVDGDLVVLSGRETQF